MLGFHPSLLLQAAALALPTTSQQALGRRRRRRPRRSSSSRPSYMPPSFASILRASATSALGERHVGERHVAKAVVLYATELRLHHVLEEPRRSGPTSRSKARTASASAAAARTRSVKSISADTCENLESRTRHSLWKLSAARTSSSTASARSPLHFFCDGSAAPLSAGRDGLLGAVMCVAEAHAAGKREQRNHQTVGALIESRCIGAYITRQYNRSYSAQRPHTAIHLARIVTLAWYGDTSNTAYTPYSDTAYTAYIMVHLPSVQNTFQNLALCTACTT